jgi:hypothetical protein
MASANRAAWMLGANACITRTYSLIRTNAYAWCNHVDGGGIKFGVIFEDLWKANACALILCSFVMSPGSLPCTDANGREYFGGLSHCHVVEMTNTKNRRAKMHAKLLC